jgi:hypothetical protein
MATAAAVAIPEKQLILAARGPGLPMLLLSCPHFLLISVLGAIPARTANGRLSWDEPAGTLTSGCTHRAKGRFVHSEQDRALTPREPAALQGFPDHFTFSGTDVPGQMGNAVPPPLALALAEPSPQQVIAASEWVDRSAASPPANPHQSQQVRPSLAMRIRFVFFVAGWKAG